MQYYAIFILNMHQIQPEKHLWMGKGEIFLRLRRKRSLFVSFWLLSPFRQTYLRPCSLSHRVRIRHRVYNLNPAQTL